MFLRSCCAFLFLVSSAAALDVYEDLTLTEANYPGGPIRVYGSASLTIAGDPDTSRVELYDTATLDVQSGSINGAIEVYGANHVRQTGGSVNRIEVRSYEATDYELLGGIFAGTLQGPTAGEHRVTIDFDGMTQAPSVIGVPGMIVNGFTANPFIRQASDGQTVIGGDAFSKIVIAEWNLNDPTGTPGDANDDGVVDLADMNEVRNFFGRQYLDRIGDGDTLPFDGRVDLDDLNRVRNTFGQAAAVPEPATLAMALLLACSLPWRRLSRGALRR